ncbi:MULTISPECIES: tryptophan halogenase family protein [unclassified Iodidimonas]|jgi:flavin-dependent dehydrogenase|uniref:tryptophan halogenase family protein n=1 Tax=unclassified Iodidimonas TaxID=2626145 RepID=UPI002482F27E|nr:MULTISPECIES: tryptophan halogenase family protein [unclassified Iodidimonas]
MSKAIRSIVIVGGGSAGWLTAGLIAAEHRAYEKDGLSVTLVESPTVPTIGVGEGTWPTMRSTLIKLGISETDFFRACDASFKQGAKFQRWVTGRDDDFYYHPLMLPQSFQSFDLAPYWKKIVTNTKQKISFSDAVCFQEAMCERNLAPKLITTPEYESVANYAYHLDAGKFGSFLQSHCTQKLGVRHILDDVKGVVAADNGDIAGLETAASGRIDGDLFIDCTGFSSLLLGRHYDVPFKPCDDVLLIDRALAVQVPYAHDDDPIVPHTLSTAQSAGWVWDIGLPSRRGVGYVYSSRYQSEEAASETLRAYVGPAFDRLSVRQIPIRSGHRQTFWSHNCVAVGLSAGFLEPLEASALVLIELSADMIAKNMPACRDVMDLAARRFNETTAYRWDRIIDFLKLHYMLSQRTDSAFWIDNRDPATIPESLRQQLEIWRYQAPGNADFTSNNEVFPAASYQYVLYGMGFETDFSYQAHRLHREKDAMALFGKNAKQKDQVLRALPKNRELIEKINRIGMQTI